MLQQTTGVGVRFPILQKGLFLPLPLEKFFLNAF